MEEGIRNLKHWYEQSKCKTKTKVDSRGNVKNKGKWDKKKARPQGTNNKENVTPPKRCNTSDKGQVHRDEQKKKDGVWKRIECWICGKDHRRRDCLQNQGARPQIYSA